ncbi:hypothetical protein AB1Y20_002824 [Prymnesium parvum]|uniref:Ubiquitinyl hydrolase 1 n=1 Tax=Prymnesium parvum TaxID=97485 RepID=A0AB34J924_PRYPA
MAPNDLLHAPRFLLHYSASHREGVEEEYPQTVLGLALVRFGLMGSPKLVVLLERRAKKGREPTDLQFDLKAVEIMEKNSVVVLAVPSASFTLYLRAGQVRDDDGKTITSESARVAIETFRSSLVDARACDRSTLEALPDGDEVLSLHQNKVHAKEQKPKRKSLGGGFKPHNSLLSGAKGPDSATPPHPLYAKPPATSFYRTSASFFGSKVSTGVRLMEAAMPAPAVPDGERSASTGSRDGSSSLPSTSSGRSLRDMCLFGAPPAAPTKSSRREALLPSPIASRAAPREGRPSPVHSVARYRINATGVASGRDERTGGFHNIGNSCYINSVLSSLLGLQPFTEDLRRVFGSLAKFVPQPSVFEALHSLANARAQGDVRVSTPRRVKDAIAKRFSQFAGTDQQDAHEFFCDAIDALHEELVRAATAAAADEITPPMPGQSASAPPLAVEQLPSMRNFHMEVEHTLCCHSCNHEWTRIEPLRDLSLNLASSHLRASDDPPTTADLLRTFFADDVLEVACEKCSAQSATVRHRICQLPRILMLHLKRFEMGEHAVLKLNHPVQPLLNLSLDFCTSSTVKPPPPLAMCSSPSKPTKRAAETPSPANAASLMQARRTLSFASDLAASNHAAPPKKSTAHVAHGPPTGVQETPPHKRPCRYFRQGYCRKGDTCPFAHLSTEAHCSDEEYEENEMAAAIAASLSSLEEDNRRRSSESSLGASRERAHVYADASAAASNFARRRNPLAADTVGYAHGKATMVEGAASNPVLLEDGSSEPAVTARSGKPYGTSRCAVAEKTHTNIRDALVVDLQESPCPQAGANGGPGRLQNSEYVLCAVVWHLGTTAGSGHYLADVRSPSVPGGASQWMRFDDAVVRPVEPSSPDLVRNGYMYFYLHRSLITTGTSSS